MMDHRRCGLLVLMALPALISACGRSALPLGQDGGQDGGQHDLPRVAETAALDRGPALDSGPAHDGFAPLDAFWPADGPCLTGCLVRCKLVHGCDLYPKGPAACLADCPTWNPLITSCLDTLICGTGSACSAVASCIVDPPRAELQITAFAVAVKGSSVIYGLTVCNAGQGTAGPFKLALTYDSSSAPGPAAPTDQTLTLEGGLAQGVCAQLEHTRTGTPPGSYAAWAEVDSEQQVIESDESNNSAGPIAYTVSPQQLPDLLVKTFTATAKGADILYTMEVCNQGGAPSWLFRLELYYKRVLAPTTYALGDQNVMFLGGLKAGACATVTRSYKNAPVGLYTSWAQVDALNTVKEANEGNNSAGPRAVTVGPQSGCVPLCSFAIGCKTFSLTEIGRCLTWCNGLGDSQRSCAENAASAKSCADLAACALPPPPPPPPPPWACLQICSHLDKTCKLLPASQSVTCIAGCLTLPETKVQCALTAMSQGQCLPMALCLL